MRSDSLRDYDDNFQSKLIASFIVDKSFFQQVIDVIDPKHFTTEMDRFVVKLMLDHFVSYKQLPTSTVLKSEIDKIKDDVLRTSIYDRLKKVRSVINATDLQYVKDEYLKFCLTKEIETALMKSADLLQIGELDGIKSLISKAFNSISDRDLGHDYLKDFEERYEKNIRNPIPTPWPVINKIMDGGLSGGEVGCVIAPSGRGKCVSKLTEVDIESNGKKERITVIELFTRLGVPDKALAIVELVDTVKIRTPHGYKKIVACFRTELQPTITCHFSHKYDFIKRVLKCSPNHELKVDGNWVCVKDIKQDTDRIESTMGFTRLRRIITNEPEILYDFSVEDVHCYYANGILSHNSWLLSAIGSHALKIGKNVIHYTLEINEYYVGKRYDSIYSGVPFSELRYKKEEVFNTIRNYDESTLLIKKYGAKKASIQTLIAHIEKCINNGLKPDLILVDYADLLKPTTYHNKENYIILQDIYVDLCGLAEEYNIPCWTCSQTSRAGISADIIEEDLIAGSYGKVMESYFILTLSRNITDKQGGTAKIFVAKNRFGPDGLTFPSKFNASNGRILIYEKDSVEGKKVSKDLDEDITTRTELRDRYNELMKKDKNEEAVDLG